MRNDKPNQLGREAREGKEEVKSSGWIVDGSQQCCGFLDIMIKAALTTSSALESQPWRAFVKQKVEGGSARSETSWGKYVSRHLEVR